MKEIVIIGAGAVGCMTAMELARRGMNVTLVDKAEAGREASWAGGGILFPLLPWNYREEVNRLALAGAAAYPALAGELIATGIDPEYRVSGMIVHPPFDADTALAWCANHDVAAELSKDGTLWMPHVAQVRNPRLMQALGHWLQAHGVRLIEHAEVSGLRAEDGRVDAVEAGEETLPADEVVVTAGAWSLPLLGEHVPVLDFRPMRGQMLLYRMPPGLLSHIHYQSDFYIIPRRDGHMLAGSTVEDAGFDKSTTAAAAQTLREKAEALLPQLKDQEPVRHWAGLRPGSPHNIPAIGRHPRLDNLWLNTGHFRYGVTMAPASARLLVALMAGEQPALDPAPYAVKA